MESLAVFRMRIYIPTYRRATAQKTWSLLPPEWRKKTTFVVDDQDKQALITRGIKATFWVHPKRVKTIAQKRAWIIESTKHEKIIMMDDDLRFCARRYLDKKKGLIELPAATVEQIGEAIEALFNKLDTHAHVTMSPRQMNNQSNNAFKHGWDENARAIYVLGYRVSVLRKYCKLGRIEHREDMDYTLQLLTQGFKNAKYMEVCVDTKYNSAGGASLERSMEASNADAKKLARWFPDFVKVVERAYKESVPRKEVIVAWKQAYEKGS
jgi:ribosomal protein L23